MSEHKGFTPGPWIASLDVDKRYWGYIRPANGEIMQGALRYPSIARVPVTQCHHSESEANAKLIADAPRLLAENAKLRALILEIHEELNPRDNRGGDYHDAWGVFGEKLRDAIKGGDS
jgi:hypothetical protein